MYSSDRANVSITERNKQVDGSITVITITRQRPQLLKRAIASVEQQDYSGSINHLVIIDECETTRRSLEKDARLPDWLVWQSIPRTPQERSGPWRLSKLRNLAVQLASSKWVCYLDDDNEFESNHLSSLIACAEQTGCRAVHSYEKIFQRDGTPYLEPRLPWCRDPEEGKRQYAELYSKGVFQPGSNVSRDRADPLGHPDPIRTVDMGEWLFERQLLLEYPFPEEYTQEDWLKITTEDDKLMLKLIENRVPIACTKIPSLKYYLGGFTNNF